MAMSCHKKDERITSLLKIISKNIAIYEDNRYPTKLPSPVKILKFLMEEHGLGQEDLTEIGSRSLVSKILSGEPINSRAYQIFIMTISYLTSCLY